MGRGPTGDVTFGVGGGGTVGGDSGGKCDDRVRVERAQRMQLVAELENMRRYTEELRAQLLEKDRQLAGFRAGETSGENR